MWSPSISTNILDSIYAKFHTFFVRSFRSGKSNLESVGDGGRSFTSCRGVGRRFSGEWGFFGASRCIFRGGTNGRARAEKQGVFNRPGKEGRYHLEEVWTQFAFLLSSHPSNVDVTEGMCYEDKWTENKRLHEKDDENLKRNDELARHCEMVTHNRWELLSNMHVK